MDTTRRSVLVAGAAFAASFHPRAIAQALRNPVTAAEIVHRIRKEVGIPWLPETVDRILFGSPDTPVTGIAVTMMATLDVVQRAAAAGKNMIITHEPTFYSHPDTTEELRDDPTFQLKTNFLRTHNMVVFRFHDHWHRMTPDGINQGMKRELGWQNEVDVKRPFEFILPEISLQNLATDMSRRLNAHSMRILGKPETRIRRVAASWGYASLMPDLITTAARPDIDLMVVGETREWELVEYVADQVTSGANKALIVLNHVVSEQAGMKYCTEWIRRFVPEVPVEFVPTREPFWTLNSPHA